MPYKLYWENKGVYIYWFGKVTYEESLKANGEIYGHPKFDHITYQLSDILEADTSLFTPKEVKVIGHLDMKSSIWNKKLKIAHIVTDPEFIALIDIYEKQMEGSGWKFKTFNNLEDARLWAES